MAGHELTPEEGFRTLARGIRRQRPFCALIEKRGRDAKLIDGLEEICPQYERSVWARYPQLPKVL